MPNLTLRSLALTLALATSHPLCAAEQLRVLIDTKSATLLVVKGDRALVKFTDISIGRAGATKWKLKGDDRTPLGTFRIAGMNGDSRFRRFFRFDYPTFEQALRAKQQGVIDEETYQSIIDAIAQNHLPPQNTPLGGNLGIHGLGDGDPGVHRLFNWTHGCIALTNEEIDVLSHYLRVGVEVVVE